MSTKYTLSRRKHKRLVDELLARDGAVCGICDGIVRLSGDDGKDKATIDHVMPLSRGGKDVVGNMQLAHNSCNNLKADLSNETARAYFKRHPHETH